MPDTFSPEQRNVLAELNRRRDQLAPEQQGALDELLHRASTPSVAGVTLPDPRASLAKQTEARMNENPDTAPSPVHVPREQVGQPGYMGIPQANADFTDPFAGAQHIGRGIAALAEPGMKDKARGVHELVGGVSRIAAPLAPLAIAASPVTAPVALGTGLAAQTGVTEGLKAAGVPEEYSDLAGDAAGIGAGSLASSPRAPGLARGLAGAVKGGAQAILDHKTYLPSAALAGIGRLTGIPHATEVGGALGALPNVVRSIGEGFRDSYRAPAPPPVNRPAPLWRNIPDTPPAEPPAPLPKPVALPSGRTPGPKPISSPDAQTAPLLNMPEPAAETPPPAAPAITEHEPAYEGLGPGRSSEEYKSAAQTVKARALARYLKIEGATLEDAQKMTPEDWAAKAKEIGVNKPSATSIERAKQELQKLYGPETRALPLAPESRNPLASPAKGPAPLSPATLESKPQVPGPLVATRENGLESTRAEADARGTEAGGTRVSRPAPASGRPGAGAETEIPIPGERATLGARYEVRDLSELQASHSGQTFAPNLKYAHHNERDYSKPENQQRIIEQSTEGRFDPRYLVTDNPDATNGPPVIDEDGNVLGGNSRVMTLERVHGRAGASSAAYRKLLDQKAAQFGIDPSSYAHLKTPVLVRSVAHDELAQLPEGAKWAIRKTNVSGTAELSASERARADAEQMTPELKRLVASAIEDHGPDATLNEALSGKAGGKILNKLIEGGFFSEQERPKLMDGKTGALTQAAKDRVSKALTGQFFEDSDQFARTPASLRNKLERAAAPIATLAGSPEWDLLPAMKQAVTLIEYADAHGIKHLPDVLRQTDMFGAGPSWTPEAVRLADVLRNQESKKVVARFRRYAASKEPTMFGQSSPAEAFADAFGE